MPPPAAFPAIPDTEEEWYYNDAVELDVEVPDAAPTAPIDPKPTSQATRISKDDILIFFTNPAMPPPDVRLCETPNGSDSLQDLTSKKIFHLFGNHCFHNYEHFCRTSKDAKFVQGVEPCPSIGEFSNLCKGARGKSLTTTSHYLDKFHLDIFFGRHHQQAGLPLHHPYHQPCHQVHLVLRSEVSRV